MSGADGDRTALGPVGPDSRLQILVRCTRSGPMARVLVAYFAFYAAELATWIAILVWAYAKGGAGTAGLMALVQLIPATLVAPFGAVLGDRLPRGRALALGYGAQALTMGATAVVLALDAPLAVVAVFAALAACSVTLTRPVHYAILPDLAGGPAELTAANSASGTVEGAAGFVGPAVGGVLLAVSGPEAVFAVMASVMAVAAAATVGLKPGRAVVATSGEGMAAAAAAGFREVLHDRAAAMLVVLVAAQSVIVGLMDILVVVLAFDLLDLGQGGPGWLVSLMGLGAVLGGFATVLLVGRQRLAPALAVGILATGLPIAVLGWTEEAAACGFFLAVSGAGISFTNVAGRTLLQRSVDGDVLARIFGIQEALMMAGLAIGSATAPLLVRTFGATGAFVATGIFLPVVGMLAWTQMRALDDRSRLAVDDLALLSRLPMFAPLSQRSLEQLALAVTPDRAGDGAVIIREGEPGERFYVIRSGEVTVTQRGRLIRRLGPGDQFGEIALLHSIPRTATVTASGEVELAALDRNDFLTAVTGAPRALVEANAITGGHLNEDDMRDR